MQPLDLTNCDREPIHIPGSIQPHGILFVIDLNSEVVLQAAGDTAGSLATQHPPLGRPLHDLLGVGLEELTQSAGVGLESKPPLPWRNKWPSTQHKRRRTCPYAG